MSLPFAQYLLPDGRQREINIDLDPEQEEVGRKLLGNGVRLEAEILTTGEVSITAEFDGSEDYISLAHEIVPNGPGIREAVCRLLETATKRWKELF